MLPFDSDNDAAVGDEAEGTVVVDFADEVDGIVLRVGGNADGDYRLVRLVERQLRRTNLRLLPPKEADGVTVRVEGFRGVESNGKEIAFLDTRRDGDGHRVIGQYNIRIKIAAALCSPLHTGAEVVELVGIETPFVAYGDAA